MKRPHFFLLSAYCLVLSASVVHAQSSNSTYSLRQETLSSGGGVIGGGNPMRAQTTLGLPAGGSASNGTFVIISGIAQAQKPIENPITMLVTLTGTVDDASGIKEVKINDEPATINGATFSKDNVLLLLGQNKITVIATDALDNVATRSITVYLDLAPEKKTPRFAIAVRGRVDEATANVWVNNVPATIGSGEFVAANVPLSSGLNDLIATSQDDAGNASSASIRVFVPLPARPPARPTAGTFGEPIPAVTTANSITIGGTKTSATSIWINGRQAVSLDDSTTWTATIELVEGDNELVIVAKDATQAQSASNIVNIIVDKLPPVVTFAPPVKTNFNPVTLQGSVDDSQTTVKINGILAKRTKRDFEASIPLTLGQNTLMLEATSPNGYRTTANPTIILGTIPTVELLSPSDGAKLYADAAVSIRANAADLENDPIQYRLQIDGAGLGKWATSGSTIWTPTLEQRGEHRLSVSVRDEYGGVNSRDVDVYVVRPPIEPP